MQRVLVVGSGGAGKTTFARQLGAVTGLPVIPLDTLYCKPGWVAVSADEWQAVAWPRRLAREGNLTPYPLRGGQRTQA